MGEKMEIEFKGNRVQKAFISMTVQYALTVTIGKLIMPG